MVLPSLWPLPGAAQKQRMEARNQGLSFFIYFSIHSFIFFFFFFCLYFPRATLATRTLGGGLAGAGRIGEGNGDSEFCTLVRHSGCSCEPANSLLRVSRGADGGGKEALVVLAQGRGLLPSLPPAQATARERPNESLNKSI